MYGLKRVHCPSTKCKGGKLWTKANVRNHLILNGREPSFKVRRGLEVHDSLDEEWEVKWRRPIKPQNRQLDLERDIRGMV